MNKTEKLQSQINSRRYLADGGLETTLIFVQGRVPEAGRYLEGTIDTGTYCRYRPL